MVAQRRRARKFPALTLRSTVTQLRVPFVFMPCVRCHARGLEIESPLATLLLTRNQSYVEPILAHTEMQVAHLRHHVRLTCGQTSRRALYSGFHWTFTQFQLIAYLPFRSSDCTV